MWRAKQNATAAWPVIFFVMAGLATRKSDVSDLRQLFSERNPACRVVSC